MIHLTEARKRIEEEESSASFFSKNGEVISTEKCIATSSNFKNGTMNIKFIESGEIRTFRAVQMFQYNGQEVVL